MTEIFFLSPHDTSYTVNYHRLKPVACDGHVTVSI